MTKIAELYDKINDKIQSTIINFSRLANPYVLEENNAMILTRAYGLAIGAGRPTGRYVGCLVSWEREFTIGLVTAVNNTESNTEGRALIEIDLIEAHRKLLMAFETDATLGGSCITCLIGQDNGIEYMAGQQGRYLALEITLRVEYQETLS